ncbi:MULTISPECIES: thiamine pyrophosphate-dependent enzyme [Pseudomonas]|uniref:thiamine pyrophosphate-dependent enzyme n=1 Tax=Pseudomonas TaxID=286 RepID=UPI00301D0583
MVRPRHPHAPGHARLAVGQAGDHGQRRALRHRRQARLSAAPVVAMVGDGAMQMNGNAELVTVQQYWQRWDSPTFIVLVLNNGDLNQVTWEQRALAGDPEFSPAQEVIDFPYARYADMLGFKGIRVDRPEDIDAAWAEAFAADRPVLLEVVTDPNVPPLPPHISFEQAKHLLGAMLQDDPKRWGVIRQSARQVLARH